MHRGTTCLPTMSEGVPVGSGRRIGIDRDEDGTLDGDEADAGSDPADPHDPPLGSSQ